MNYRKLGKTNFAASEIGHGLWGMGDWKDSNDIQSLRTLQLSLEKGCNFFDSAWSYGSGRSDQLLGKLIQKNPDACIFTASKVPPKNMKWPARSEDRLEDVFPRQHVIEYTQKILEGLGTDHLDLLQFHVWDDAWTEHDEWKETIEYLKGKKLIRNFGISLNRWEPWNGIKAIETGLIDTVQVIYNIFDQAPEDKLFSVCRENNIGIIARVPLDEGGLTGKLNLQSRFPKGDWRAKYFGKENLVPTVKRAEALSNILPQGMTLPEMALRFILSNPIVSTTIIGMRNLNHVIENFSICDGVRLSDEMLALIKNHRWDRKISSWSD